MGALTHNSSRTRWVCVLVACALAASCSFVEFERSPYSARDLVVVYSAQEDMTFLSWKLGAEADLNAADFELFRDGDYRPIDLAEAPYPASAYACGSDEVCLQYQVDGRLSVSPETSPIRTIHRGVWGGPRAEVRRADETIAISPFAIDNNETIDPGLQDWFADNGVPLRRDFQFQLVTRDHDCAPTAEDGWLAMHRPTPVDYDWVEAPACFATRPARRDAPGPVVSQPVEPSAETHFERQVYEPPRERSPIIYGVLLDLHVADKGRCHRVKRRLLDIVSAAFASRGDPLLLDVYLPKAAQTGESIEDCDQQPNRYYPTNEMLLEAEVAAAPYDPQEVRVVWLYVSNSRLPVSEALLADLRQLEQPPEDQPNLAFFNWSIGYGWISAALDLDMLTGWRPVDDETLEADIESFARSHLPFLTMKHEDHTEVPISRPADSDDPRYFKLCTAQPPYAAIGNAPGQPPQYDATSPAIDWPAGDGVQPFYTVELTPQHLVPRTSYRNQRVEVVVEACRRFCDHGFRTRGGREYDSWMAPEAPRPMEVCQWNS